jgi:hypothetical protein
MRPVVASSARKGTALFAGAGVIVFVIARKDELTDVVAD